MAPSGGVQGHAAERGARLEVRGVVGRRGEDQEERGEAQLGHARLDREAYVNLIVIVKDKLTVL